MLKKVKAIGSKLLGSSSKDEESSPQGSGFSRFSLKVNKGADESSSHARNTSSTFSRSSAAYPDPVQTSGGSRSALPPVQVNQPSFTQRDAPRPPANVANALSPTNTGRRKSTPAALDMALRTAEGKAALEDLINSGGKKQMVFGQYFGGPSKAQPAPAPTRFSKAQALAQAHAAMPGITLVDKSLGMVQEHEDDDLPGVASTSQSQHQSGTTPRGATPAAASPPGSIKRPADSVSSVHEGLHSHHAVPAPAPAPPPTPPAPVPAPAQYQPATAAAPMHRHVVEEEPPPGKRTKILAMAPQLPAGMARKYWSLSDYAVSRKMYTGYASTVYQATCKKSLEQVALKVYHMENLCELNHYQVYREIRLHSSLQHQHIIQLFCAFQEGNDVVLVQEYAEGGDLYRLLHKNGGRLSERQAVEMVLHPFLLAMHYLHTHGIMHRDIKPENVLFTEHRVLKLADFGLAIDLNEERAVTRAGTLDYMAPEVLRCPPKNLPEENKGNTALHYNNSVDAWAVGVFAYELIVGFPPFAGESQVDSVDKIIHSTPEFPEKMSEIAKSFITAALKKHPGDRPTVMEMLHHPWIRTYQRRTSVRIPAVTRRRSSMSYNSPSVLPAAPEEGPVFNAPANMDNMTPEEIEDMIQQLQMAKHFADRAPSVKPLSPH